MTLFKLTIANIKMYIRDRQALFWAFFFPLLLMTVFGVMNFEGSGKLSLGVVNLSPSPAAGEFISTLGKSESLKITKDSREIEEAALKKGDRDAVMILPEDFLADPQKASPYSIKVLVNKGRPQQSGTALSVLGSIFSEMERNMTQKPKLFAIETEDVAARNLRYIDFVVPGVVALSIMQLSIFGIGFTIVEYKRKGVMKRLFVTPLKPLDFTLSHVIMRLIVSIFQVSILFAVAILFFNVTVIGNFASLYLFVILGGLLFLSFGFALAGISKTEDALQGLAQVFVFPQMFLGNVFFSTDAMPEWLQKAVVYLPLNYLSDAIRKISTEGAGIMDLQRDIIGILVWIAIGFILAIKLFRWREAANS